ncbi:LytR/AlgR family response regulator transcription factor [Dyella caseinilytica]|uniref:Response regulator transcription factor n=1 Tax=Dyella caseinilytica TaxID=1849581 RepID=A0ABX7GZI3_9GAMM|nr:LytTR family DNA-binding domain-containing protein [Dyella caseinilytica]QRN55366.1 response regulator transcription factor [Dyella caseinilytica]GGA01204.1 DNA-binding response regulator [Dyella caseinilytica]
MSLRLVIIDDEAPARDKLRRYLAHYEDVHIAGEASNGRDALTLISREQPDVVLLDINMPDMDGFAVLQALGEPLPAEIVFVTAHDDRALQAFDVHAFDYLLKPVSPDRFDRLIQRLRERLMPRQDIGKRLDGLLEALPAPMHYLEHLLVQADDSAQLLRIDRISRMESSRNYLDVYAEGHCYRLRGTLENMLLRLNPVRFARINRSTLVRLDAIREVQPWPEGEYRLLLDDDARVTWTRRYLENLPPGLLLRL